MNSIPQIGRSFPADVNRRLLMSSTLASFLVELNRDPLDHSPLTEQLRIWHRDFGAALRTYDDIEPVIERYVQVLLNDIRVPEDQYRMLQPVVDFLQRNHVPIPQQLERPSAEQVLAAQRATQVEALRARRQRHMPVPPQRGPEPDPILAGRITALQERNENLAQRMAVVDARRQADDAAMRQRLEELEQRGIPEVRERVVRLRETQEAVTQDRTQAARDLQQLERDVAETKQALKDKQKDSLGGVLVALVTVAACIAINMMLPAGAAAGVGATKGGSVKTFLQMTINLG
jgi:hypothetical protein